MGNFGIFHWLIIIAIILVVYFITMKRNKPSATDIISAKAQLLELYAVTSGDSKYIRNYKIVKIKETEDNLSRMMSDIRNGTDPIKKSDIIQGIMMEKEEVRKVYEKEKLLKKAKFDLLLASQALEASIQKLVMSLKVREEASDEEDDMDELSSRLDDYESMLEKEKITIESLKIELESFEPIYEK